MGFFSSSFVLGEPKIQAGNAPRLGLCPGGSAGTGNGCRGGGTAGVPKQWPEPAGCWGKSVGWVRNHGGKWEDMVIRKIQRVGVFECYGTYFFCFCLARKDRFKKSFDKSSYTVIFSPNFYCIHLM